MRAHRRVDADSPRLFSTDWYSTIEVCMQNAHQALLVRRGAIVEYHSIVGWVLVGSSDCHLAVYLILGR